MAVLAAAGCATPPAAPLSQDAKQSLVAERAQQRWDALIKNDLDAAYLYVSPASRQVVSLDKFKADIRRGAFRAARVEATTCDGDACSVRLAVTYDHPKMKGITTPLGEAWIIDGGQAWYVYGGR